MYLTLLSAFTVIALAVSLSYFCMFSKHQPRFMQFWGLSWILYSVSLICLIIHVNIDNSFLLEIRKTFDMLNVLFLLFGVFAFMHVSIPRYWYRFSFYLILLALITIIYDFDLLSFYLPLSIYQTIITGAICYNIIKYWMMPLPEKLLAVTLFTVWGVGKAVASIFELYSSSMLNLYITELVLFNLLNFCILVIYVRHNNREFELSEHLYKRVVENAKDAILYYKLQPYASFEYVTPSIENLTGHAPKAFYSDPRFYLELVTSEYFDEISDVFGGRLEHEGGNIFYMRKNDGTNFWGEIASSVVKDNGGNPIAVECFLRDITEMHSAQLEEIKAKKSRELLLSYISHELRSPLTSISGYLAALNDGVIKKPSEISEALETITTKTHVLQGLIDDLDQLSKFETNQFSFDFMSHEVYELTEYLLLEHMPELKNSDLDVKINMNESELRDNYIIADQSRINQVFSNLLSNAIKYSPRATSLEITFAIDDEANNFVTCVKDAGQGISDSDIPHIFEKFYRGHFAQPDNVPHGRGLGLTLSFEIIKSHKGEIFVESAPNEGSKFTFTIPLFEEAQNAK